MNIKVSVFDKFKNDALYRTKIFLYVSLTFNIAYSSYLFVSSLVVHSKWFFIMSIYYGLLSIVRAFLFVQINPDTSISSKIKTMRGCGLFLLLIDVVVSAMFFILLEDDYVANYGENQVIMLATYTFISFGVMVANGTRVVKKNDHVYSSAKILSLNAASVSLVTLTNTMLSTWGNGNTSLRNVLLPTVSGVVAVFVIICAIIMILKSYLDLRTLEFELE